jgi:hypothetical protein
MKNVCHFTLMYNHILGIYEMLTLEQNIDEMNTEYPVNKDLKFSSITATCDKKTKFFTTQYKEVK